MNSQPPAIHFQPDGSNICGQTCLAMILGIPLDDAIEIIGHRSCTTGPMLVNALRSKNVPAAYMARRFSKPHRLMRDTVLSSVLYTGLPRRCILKVRWSGVKNISHWVLYWDHQVYDPCRDGLSWNYVTGYIEILEGER